MTIPFALTVSHALYTPYMHADALPDRSEMLSLSRAELR